MGLRLLLKNKELIKSLDFNCLVDIGANAGQFSTLCYHCKDNIQIYAFEPITSCFQKLVLFFKNVDNIQIENVALGNKIETI